MNERWQREVQRLRDVEPSPEVWKDARTRTPNGDDGLPPTRQRLVAGVVAFAVFVGAGFFVWQSFRPSDPLEPIEPATPSATIAMRGADGGPSASLSFDGSVQEAVFESYRWCSTPDDCRMVTTDLKYPPLDEGIAMPVGTPITFEGGRVDRFVVRTTEGDRESTNVVVDADGTDAVVPDEPGEYLIWIAADWDRGSGAFYLRVQAVAPINREHALVVSTTEPGVGQEVPNTFTENEPRPTMTVTFEGVALDGTPVSYTWCQEPGVGCSSVTADYDITFFQPVPAGTDVIVEGDANDVSGSFHLWRGEGPSLSMADDVPVTPGSYELLVDATFDRGEVTFSVGIKVIDAQPAEAEPSMLMPDAFDCDAGEALDIEGEPDYQADYLQRWQTHDGCEVRLDYVMTRTGGCMAGVDDLLIGWPFGESHQEPGDARIFVRDPSGLTGNADGFDGDAVMPEDARDTGLRWGEYALWLVPGQSDAAWLLASDHVERWPRAVPPIACA